MILLSTYREKLSHFQQYSGMYVRPFNYDTAITFIGGMDFMSDGEMLKGFDEWVVERYAHRSQLYWGAHMRCIYDNKLIGGQQVLSKTDVEFLFDVVFEFLTERDGIAPENPT
jgi:hypothetical protein